MQYFDKLNYTLSNEDTRVEYGLLKPNAAEVFSISGSGARVLPLLARNPKRLTVVDVSPEQLYLCELRVAAAKCLTHAEYLFLLGYRGGVFWGALGGDSRLDLLSRLSLSAECRNFWESHADTWAKHGIIYLGSWERHFVKLAKIFQGVLRMDVRKIFEAESLEEQRDLFKKHWHPVRFQTFLRIVASDYVFNKFLYKGHFSGASGRRTDERPTWKALEEEFTRIFQTTLVRKQYMMQLFFLGKVEYEEGLPLETQPEILAQIRESETKIEYKSQDLMEALGSRPFDFVSLSDTISYIPSEFAQDLLQKMPGQCPPTTRVVIRSFLRAPESFNLQGWKELKEAEVSAREMDGTAIYQFHIFEKL
jgi:S-adenosylmethionine-diacylglycerol 3-amino-3-carboxypropyl transferase